VTDSNGTEHRRGVLLECLDEVKERTRNRLVGWLKDELTQGLEQRAVEAIELKEDYERALFVRLGYQSLSENWEGCADGMASLELLDSSLLIVDDIIDDAARRMGKETRSAKANSLNSAELSALLEFVESTYSAMYVGEYLDLRYERRSLEEVSIDSYLNMIRRTTGFHLGMAIKAGGMLAHAAGNDLRILWEIGLRAGTILQIRDDFIDYLDREDITHKPAFGDFQRKKKRLPLILAWQFFPESIQELQNAAFDHSTKKEVQALVSHQRVVDKCREVVQDVYSDTDSLIGDIRSACVRKALLDFFNLIRRV